jgi:thioredoxin 1
MKRFFAILALISAMFSMTFGACKAGEVSKQKQPERIVLAFQAPWCGACRANEGRLRLIEKKGIRVERINIDEYPVIAKQYGITKVPTYVITENGKEVQRTNSIFVLLKLLKLVIRFIL